MNFSHSMDEASFIAELDSLNESDWNIKKQNDAINTISSNNWHNAFKKFSPHLTLQDSELKPYIFVSFENNAYETANIILEKLRSTILSYDETASYLDSLIKDGNYSLATQLIKKINIIEITLKTYKELFEDFIRKSQSNALNENLYIFFNSAVENIKPDDFQKLIYNNGSIEIINQCSNTNLHEIANNLFKGNINSATAYNIKFLGIICLLYQFQDRITQQPDSRETILETYNKKISDVCSDKITEDDLKSYAHTIAKSVYFQLLISFNSSIDDLQSKILRSKNYELFESFINMSNISHLQQVIDIYGRNLLHNAMLNKLYKQANLLKSKGFSIEQKDIFGKTPDDLYEHESNIYLNTLYIVSGIVITFFVLKYFNNYRSIFNYFKMPFSFAFRF